MAGRPAHDRMGDGETLTGAARVPDSHSATAAYAVSGGKAAAPPEPAAIKSDDETATRMALLAFLSVHWCFLIVRVSSRSQGSSATVHHMNELGEGFTFEFCWETVRRKNQSPTTR